MKSKIIIAAALSLTLFNMGCSKSTSTAIITGDVLFVNGCVGATSLNAVVNNTNTASNINFLADAGLYLPVNPSSQVNIAFYKSSTSILISKTEEIQPTNHYSCFAGGSSSAPYITMMGDNLFLPLGVDSVKVRFVNLSPDKLKLNCFAGDQELENNLPITTDTTYQPQFHTILAGSMQLVMQDSTSNTAKALIANQLLSPNHIYTILFTGTSNGFGNNGYTLTTILNL